MLARISRWALWLPVAFYALKVARTFFLTADSAVHLTTDDGVANIAYALATEGRYGFLSSPVLFGMPRDQGLFSYGPFYFYIAAALIWLFGYSLTIVRSIHLAVMIAIAIAARSWFGQTAGGAAGAITAIGVLVAFERGQWPMARPDSIVSLCAVLLVITSGMAIRTGRARYWLAAGFAGAAGALTHLVAWSLIPAAGLIFVLATIVSARVDGRWQTPPGLVKPLVALIAGGLAAAFLFYASFGFRIADQLRFLRGYQDMTGSMSSMAEPSGAYWAVIAQHFRLAYWFLPYPLEYAVAATLLAGVAVVFFLIARGSPAWGRQWLPWVGPPVVVWIAYVLSLGVYNNFHAGYAILNQVMWVWCVGAMIAALLDGLESWPSMRRVAVAASWVVAFALGVGVLTLLGQRTEYRALAAGAAVPIRQYTDRVFEALPAAARTWGPVALGIEHPGRVQLIQFDDASTVVQALDARARAAASPDFVVVGFTDARDAVVALLAGAAALPNTLANFFPDVQYELVSMTAGAPYGVTRVYKRHEAAAAPPPTLAVYDPRYRRWTRALAAAETLTMAPAAPAQLMVGGDASAHSHTAAQSLTGNLAAGTYLLRVALAPDSPVGLSAVFMASPSAAMRDRFGDYGMSFDAVLHFAGERAVHLVYEHAGGAFYVNQFGAGPAAIAGVDASRLLPIADLAASRRPVPAEQPMPASSWELPEPVPQVGPHPVEIRHTPGADGVSLQVNGNAVQYGYQAYGPRIAVEPFDYVRLRFDLTIQTGTACIGVLDGTGKRWLVLPDRLQTIYEFQVNDSRTIKPVLANCSGTPVGIVPITAIIRDGSYASWSERGELYVDQLMREYRQARPQ